MESFSLKQGKKLKSKKYQKYIEGFTDTNDSPSDTLPYDTNTNSTTDTSNSTDPDIVEADELQAKIKDLLNQLNQVEAKTTDITDEYIDSTDPLKNTYLNKNIHFSNGQYGYVTGQSELKMYPTEKLYNANKGNHGCPADATDVNFAFPDKPKLGTSITISDRIKLILGIPIMKEGESCGYEGQNVYVDKLITNTTATYQGCYADNKNSPTMTFINGSPPKGANLINGNFDQHPTVDTYKYVSSSSDIPGWNIDAVLINWTDSNNLGFLQAPNGNFFISLQGASSIFQTILLDEGTYTLTWSSVGWTSNTTNKIQVYCNDYTIPINIDTSTPIFTYSPPTDNWTSYSTTINIETSQNYNIGFFGTNITEGNNSAAGIQNIILTNETYVSTGNETYDSCKKIAIDNGYQYFALQDVNSTKQTGFCSVTNNSIGATWYGESKVPVELNAIWSSNTNMNPNNPESGGKYAKLTKTGSLVVLDKNNAVIFTTPIPENTSSSYIGCYTDTGNRAMSNISDNKYIELDDCKQLAIDKGLTYYAVQDVKSSKDSNGNEVGIGWCAGSNSLDVSEKYGVAGNCAPMSKTDNRMGGRGWSNAIYSNSPDSPHFLTLNDNGSMVIHKGSNFFTSSKIWEATLTSPVQDKNPTRTAAKGKFKKIYMTSADDQILYPGDFIGSFYGSIYLIMQTDGNLVLYTTKLGTNCNNMGNDNLGGGENANALYKLDEIAFPDNMSKYGYINANSKLLEYPQDMLSNSYTSTTGYLSDNVQIVPGNNWTDGSSDETIINEATDACNKESKSSQFVINYNVSPSQYILTTGNTSLTKLSNGYTTYLKTQTLTNNHTCNKSINNIDTIQWENYLKGPNMTPDTTCSVGKLTTLQTKKEEYLRKQLEDTGNQLIAKLNIIEDKNNQMNTQMNSEGTQIREDIVKYQINAKKLLSYSNKQMKGGRQSGKEGYQNAYLDNIVDDSTIVSTQSIYMYLIWGIIATVIVIITIELFTNNFNKSLWKLVFLTVIITIMNLLFQDYALYINIIIVVLFVIKKRFKIMNKEAQGII